MNSVWQFVDPSGQGLVVPQKLIDPFRIEFVAPPYVLNETDISVNLTMHLSFSGQRWFEVKLKLDTPFPIVYYGTFLATHSYLSLLQRNRGCGFNH